MKPNMKLISLLVAQALVIPQAAAVTCSAAKGKIKDCQSTYSHKSESAKKTYKRGQPGDVAHGQGLQALGSVDAHDHGVALDFAGQGSDAPTADATAKAKMKQYHDERGHEIQQVNSAPPADVLGRLGYNQDNPDGTETRVSPTTDQLQAVPQNAQYDYFSPNPRGGERLLLSPERVALYVQMGAINKDGSVNPNNAGILVAVPRAAPQQPQVPVPVATQQPVPQSVPTAVQAPTPTATPPVNPDSGALYFIHFSDGQVQQLTQEQVRNRYDSGVITPNGQLSDWAKEHGYTMLKQQAPTLAPNQAPNQVQTATPTPTQPSVPPLAQTPTPVFQAPNQAPNQVQAPTPTPVTQSVPTIVQAPTQVPQQAPTPKPTAIPQPVPTLVQAPTQVPQQAPTPKPTAIPQLVPTLVQAPTQVATPQKIQPAQPVEQYRTYEARVVRYEEARQDDNDPFHLVVHGFREP